MKFLKSTLAVVLGASVLCSTLAFTALPTTKAVSEANFAASQVDAQTWENTFSGQSGAIYQKSQKELNEPDTPGLIKQFVTATFVGLDGGVSSCVDTVRRSSLIRALPTPTAQGLIFKGWYIDRYFHSEFKVSENGYPLIFNRTFYAKWVNAEAEKYNRLVIHLRKNDSSYQEEVSYILVAKDSTFDLPTIRRDGYSFDGWYTYAYNEVGPTKTITPTYAETHLYGYLRENPNWNKKIYKISYHINEVDTIVSDTLTGDTVISNGIDLQPSANMRFDGWYLDAELTQPAFVNGNGITLANYADEDFVVHLYAKWTQIEEVTKFTVTYYVNYTAEDSTVFKTETIEEGNTLNSLPSIVRAGYTFEGWYLDREGTQSGA